MKRIAIVFVIILLSLMVGSAYAVTDFDILNNTYGYYHFDNTTLNSSAGGNDLTETTGINYNIDGLFSQAMNITAQHVSLTATGFDIDTSGSVSGWYYWHSTSTADDLFSFSNSITGIRYKNNNKLFDVNLGVSCVDAGTGSSFTALIDQWYHIVVTWNDSSLYIYVNNSLIDEYSCAAVDNSEFDMGSYLSGAFKGKVDELILRDKELNSDEIAYLYNDGNGRLLSPEIFVPPTPPDGGRNNTQVIINSSCESDNITLWFDNNPDPITRVLDQVTSPAGYTTTVIDTNTYYYKASCDAGATNSSIRTWIYDTVDPEIILNGDNFFNVNNLSLQNQYNNSVYVSINFTDNFDLFGYLFNITKGGIEFYSNQSESLDGTKGNYTGIINISSFTEGEYDINIISSDSHTAIKIDNYMTTIQPNKISYNTSEGNNIIIESLDDSTTQTTKKTDRYNFQFDFKDKLTKERTFKIYCDKKLYLRDTGLKGHFVCGDAKGGNWIDFEGVEGKPLIEKVNDNNYIITFPSLGSTNTFNSIGGLNTIEKNYKWYRGNATTDTPITFDGFTNTVFLNLTRNSTITNILATLIYNNTIYNTTKTTTSTSILFEQEITNPILTSNLNKTIQWNITIIQDTINYTQQLNIEQEIFFWNLDNCSNYTTPAFNFEIRDENTNNLIFANVSYVYNFFNDLDETVNKQYSITMLNQNNYSFCKTPSFVNLTGDMSHTVTSGTHETRNFIRIGVPYTGTFVSYLVQISATVQTVLFKIVDTTLASIEGAVMQFTKVINSVPTIVATEISDFAGQVSLPLDSTTTYQIQINASGFPLKTFNLKPALSGYTIKLNSTGDTLFSNNYEGIRYKITPSGRTFNASNEFINFTFELDGSNLEYFGLNFSRHNFECIPANCQNISTSSNGGIVTVKIKVNATSRFYTNLFFKVEGKDQVNINSWPNDGVIFYKAAKSAINLLDNIKEDVGPMTLAILAAFIQVVIIGIAVQVGVAGIPLIMIGAASVMILSIPQIGLINPLFGVFLAIVGFIMYGLLAMVSNQ